MKKLLLFALVLAFVSSAVCAESARDYAAWLEEALPGAAFTDAQVPEFVLEKLGADYEFVARSDLRYGSYIAGVRRESAPELPADVHESAFGGTFETRIFRAEDASGKIWYEFVLGDGVNIGVYDGMQRIVIDADPAEHPGEIFQAADAQGRAQLIYGNEMGFSCEDESRAQLCFPVHSLESWSRNATDQPHAFYMDVEVPGDVTGPRWLEREDLIKFTRIPIGLYLKDGKTSCELVVSEDGGKGVVTDDPLRLYEAGPGYDALVDMAEKALGYRPGQVDFLGKRSVRAEMRWHAGELSRSGTDGITRTKWDAGCVEISDAASLQKLDALLASADFSVGSVNCPSDLFLVVEYDDGSSADFAVAVNSFDLFFRNGMYFTVGDDSLLDIFDFRRTDFYMGYVGG